MCVSAIMEAVEDWKSCFETCMGLVIWQSFYKTSFVWVFSVCVCVLGCLQAGVHAHVFACMCQPEDNFACGSPGAMKLSTLFIKTRFLHWLGACRLVEAG